VVDSSVPNCAEHARTEKRFARYAYAAVLVALFPAKSSKPQENQMVISATELSPIVALIAGILILIIPRLLNFIVAIYLIFIGLVGLNGIHHWVNFH
jgi:cobalamin synthase